MKLHHFAIALAIAACAAGYALYAAPKAYAIPPEYLIAHGYY